MRDWVTDWEPFDYFSVSFNDPAREGINLPQTYHLAPSESGTEFRITTGQAHDAEGNRSEISETELVGFLSSFWPASLAELEVLMKATN